MNAIYVIVIMILVLAAYHLVKASAKMIKEILAVPLKGANASLKGIKKVRAKIITAKYNKSVTKDAMKQLKLHAIENTKAESNGFKKSDKTLNLEKKLK